MNLGEEILDTIESIRADVSAFAESRKYYLISYDTEPDLISRFPALAYFISAISASPSALSYGSAYEFSVTIVLYKKLPLSGSPQPDEEVADIINYFAAKGYEISAVGMEDSSVGSALLRRAEISIKLSKLIK